jgi:predicted RNA-binding Zn-ribbon protein involved in translation (DUF1610 family)
VTKYRPGTITIEDPSIEAPHPGNDAFVFECPKCGAMWRDQ